MTLFELTSAIIKLVPDAKMSVWDGDGDYFGDEPPTIRLGFRISWSLLNTQPCPTEDEISAAL